MAIKWQFGFLIAVKQVIFNFKWIWAEIFILTPEFEWTDKNDNGNQRINYKQQILRWKYISVSIDKEQFGQDRVPMYVPVYRGK